MKNLIALYIISSLSTCCFAKGETKEKPISKTDRNTVYINPLSLSIRTINISYERFLNQRFSTRIGVISGKIYPGGKPNRAVQQFEFNGILLEGRRYSRVYPEKPAEDFYFGPYLQYFQDQIADYQYTKSTGIVRDDTGNPLTQNKQMNVIKAGLMAGTRQIYFKRLAIDINAGMHYQHPSENVRTSTEIINLMASRGVSFKIGFNAGLVF